jgi:hypothetical protein
VGQTTGESDCAAFTGCNTTVTADPLDPTPPLAPCAEPAAAPAPVSLTAPLQHPAPSPAPALAVARPRRIPRQPDAYEAVPATAAWSSQDADGGSAQQPAEGELGSESDGSYA